MDNGRTEQDPWSRQKTNRMNPDFPDYCLKRISRRGCVCVAGAVGVGWWAARLSLISSRAEERELGSRGRRR